MKVLLTGASGRLGAAILHMNPDGWDIVPFSGSGGPSTMECDLRRAGDRRRLLKNDFDLAVNTAALSSPAECSRRPGECILLNTIWPLMLARACRERSVPMVNISSDLVYSGGNPPYGETSAAVPRSFYGWTKLAADILVERANSEALTVRTSVLCGETPSRRTTFSQDILSGRVNRVYVNSWRNHTPMDWLAGLVPVLVDEGATGLVIASGRYARSRSAYAEALLVKRGMPVDHLVLDYAPAGIPPRLDLRGKRSCADDVV